MVGHRQIEAVGASQQDQFGPQIAFLHTIQQIEAPHLRQQDAGQQDVRAMLRQPLHRQPGLFVDP